MKISNEAIDKFLDSPCLINEWEKSTWREWMADLLVTLFAEGGMFSGKRPNCDSGWEDGLEEAIGRFWPEIDTLEESRALRPAIVARLCSLK